MNGIDVTVGVKVSGFTAHDRGGTRVADRVHLVIGRRVGGSSVRGQFKAPARFGIEVFEHKAVDGEGVVDTEVGGDVDSTVFVSM